MQSTTLMIMRHAKTEWQASSGLDYDRCLTDRGQRNAPQMGQWLITHDYTPDKLIASTAKRAEQTAIACAAQWQHDIRAIQWEKSIYNASLTTLLGIVGTSVSLKQTSLLIGHNPGLAELILYLCADRLPDCARANFMPTGAIAVLHNLNAENVIDYGAWECVDYMTPKRLKDCPKADIR